MELWIARDADGALCLFNHKPFKNGSYFMIDDTKCDAYNWHNVVDLDKKMLPEVTFENSPQKVELKLK